MACYTHCQKTLSHPESDLAFNTRKISFPIRLSPSMILLSLSPALSDSISCQPIQKPNKKTRTNSSMSPPSVVTERDLTVPMTPLPMMQILCLCFVQLSEAMNGKFCCSTSTPNFVCITNMVNSFDFWNYTFASNILTGASQL